LTNVEQKSPWEQIFLNSPF